MTERLRENGYVDEVTLALEYFNSEVGDHLSDTYVRLLNIATVSDGIFQGAHLWSHERWVPLDEARRGRIERYLSILAYAAHITNSLLGVAESRDPGVKRTYHDHIQLVMEMYNVSQEVINGEVKDMEDKPYMRPYWLVAEDYRL